MKTESPSEILYALLGSHRLVIKWWSSPNKAFDGKTPLDVWTSDGGKEKVLQYLHAQLSGDYL